MSRSFEASSLIVIVHVSSRRQPPLPHGSPQLRMENEDVVMQVDSLMITALREAVKDCGDRGLQFASKWSVTMAGRVPQKGLISVHRTGRRNYSYLSLIRNCLQCPAVHSMRPPRHSPRRQPGRRQYLSQTRNQISLCTVTLPSYKPYQTTSDYVNSNSRCAKGTSWPPPRSALNIASSNAQSIGSTNVVASKLCS